MNLTAAQRQALGHIAVGRIRMRNTGYGSWRILGPSHPGVVGRVVSLGLAMWETAGPREKVAALTPAGLALVREVAE